MRPRLVAMIFGFALTAASPALADEPSVAVYGIQRAAGSAQVESEGDKIADVADVLGYSFGKFWFRNMVEVAHRFRFDFEAQDGTVPATESEANLATTTALPSVRVEWRNDTNFTPFAGLTAGWARNATDTTGLNLSIQTSAESDKSADCFAYDPTRTFAPSHVPPD